MTRGVKQNINDAEISIYFNEVKRHKKISREDEKRLLTEAQKGNDASYKKIIENNLNFVVNIAKQYRNRGVPFSDLIEEGNIGLMHALRKFDTSRDVKFISYAVWWIRYYIERAISEMTSDNETSLDEMVNSENTRSYELINEEFEDELNKITDRRDTVQSLLKCLKDRELKIIEMSFGLNGECEMTLDEISKATDLSMERVRQIKESAMTKLKCEVLSYSVSEFNEIKDLR